jgi:hypothetical protein
MDIARFARRAGQAVALAGCLALAGVATPAFADPPGNNGTIKIDGVPFDDHPNNEPHVGCTFQVDFYGFDKADEANVTFKAHPPTGDRQELLTDTVFIGEDDNSGGGSKAGLDASEIYTLKFDGIEPHPKQGFHVKLTIKTDDGRKHKVFWVQGCEQPTPTPTTTKTPTPTPTHTKTPKPTPTATKTPTTKPSSESPAPVPTAVPAGADSGAGGGFAAGVIGLLLTTGGVVAGTAVIARRRFLHGS